MFHPSDSSPQLLGPLRVVVLAVALGATASVLVVFALAVPQRFRQLAAPVSPQDPVLFPSLTPAMEAGPMSRLGPEEEAALHALGISNRVYAAYVLCFDIALVVLGAGIAAVIFWRKTDNILALLIAFNVVLVGTSSVSLVIPSLNYSNPAWYIASLLLGMIGMASHVHLFFLSPDGRFVPAWTSRVAAVCTGAIFGFAVYAVWSIPNALAGVFALVALFLIWIPCLGVGILSQVYRYTRISNPIQRQQSKWIAVGLTMILFGIVVNAVFLNYSYLISGPPRLVLYLLRPPLVNGFLMFFALGLAFSIFRYRLWDIDFLIRRTTSYAILTGFLAAIYFGMVVSIQTVFSGFNAQQSPLSIVVSTLTIAALFRPLQTRIQHFIDSRFYRTKYDAERTLAWFATEAREEVDIDLLAGSLMDVVETTMQPKRVSLWIRD